jgi:hypothetical protein
VGMTPSKEVSATVIRSSGEDHPRSEGQRVEDREEQLLRAAGKGFGCTQ